jgi:2-keto-4-pentenoate hydratase/2-oxohepta-3-ene-1,7-dioic acid hydratase in catechol pathway
VPGKVLAMWNNFHALSQKLGLGPPAEPLYLLKTPNSYLNPGETIRQPLAEGKVAFEGELGIVIGKTCFNVNEADAMDYVFGYTCANDVTLGDIIKRDPTFQQWVRAKGFDTFCPFGPVISTGLDPAMLVVRTILNGEVRQDYPINDMVFSVQQLVSLISRDMTLDAGDILLCGTSVGVGSVGVGSMRAGSTVEVEIDGIGKLSNHFN